MSVRPSFPRRIALALMGHAARVLPSARAPWAEAMQHEIHHIENDLEALMWAAGCVLAGYVERSRVMSVLNSDLARALLALLIGCEAFSMLFATVLTAAWRLHDLEDAAFLGAFTPGDDYRRFIPLMNATPWWIHALWVSAAVLFVVSALQLLRQRRAAFPLFAAAWVLGTAGNLISLSMPAYKEAFSFPAPMFMRDYFIPALTALVPVFIAAALWAHSRCSPAGGLSQNQDSV
jgi:hypothetical protein